MYAEKKLIDEIGLIEAKGRDFTKYKKRLMNRRKSSEGGFSSVYSYSDDDGIKFLIHEVTDAKGVLLHRDFDAVRIKSGQLINKLH